MLEARSGDHALSVANDFEGAIDLLLTDVVMPRMGGRELSEILHRSNPNMKQIFMSGYTDDAVVRYGIRDACVIFLAETIHNGCIGEESSRSTRNWNSRGTRCRLRQSMFARPAV